MSTSGGNWKEMFTAVQREDLELVRYHLSTGIDPNYQHPEVLTTPLIEAAQQGNTEMVLFLLEQGADPHIRSEFEGWTALEAAESHRHREVARVLRTAMGLPEKSSFFSRLFSWFG